MCLYKKYLVSLVKLVVQRDHGRKRDGVDLFLSTSQHNRFLTHTHKKMQTKQHAQKNNMALRTENEVAFDSEVQKTRNRKDPFPQSFRYREMQKERANHQHLFKFHGVERLCVSWKIREDFVLLLESRSKGAREICEKLEL